MSELSPSTADLRLAADEGWSLDGDHTLLLLIQNIHKNIVEKAEFANKRMDEMVSALNDANISLQNVNNRLMSLSSEKFVESKVQEDDIDTQEHVPEELESKQVSGMSDPVQDICNTLLKLENYFEPITISMDSDTDSDGENEREVLVMKDMYPTRPLPYIIGTEEFESSWHVGLLDEGSEVGSLVSDPSVTDDEVISINMEKEIISKDEISVERDKTIPKENKSQSDIAAELAQRLNSSVVASSFPAETSTPVCEQSPRKLYKQSVYSTEPPPLDMESSDNFDMSDNVSDTSDSFADRNPSINKRTVEPVLKKAIQPAKADRRLFAADSSSDEELFHPRNDSRSKQDSERPVTRKKPSMGVSIFGNNHGGENIAAAILKRKADITNDNYKQEITNDNAAADKSSNGNNNVKTDVGYDNFNKNDYYSNSNLNDVDSKQTLNNRVSTLDCNSNESEATAKMNRSVINSKTKTVDSKTVVTDFDSLFDDLDDDSLFSSVNIKVRSVDRKNDLFDDDLFNVKENSGTTSSGKIKSGGMLFDDNDDSDLFNVNSTSVTGSSKYINKNEESKTKVDKLDANLSNKNENVSDSNLSEIVKVKCTPETRTNSINSEIFNIRTDVKDANVNESINKPKSKLLDSLFDSDDDDDDELFASILKKKPLKQSIIKQIEPLCDKVLKEETNPSILQRNSDNLFKDTLILPDKDAEQDFNNDMHKKMEEKTRNDDVLKETVSDVTRIYQEDTVSCSFNIIAEDVSGSLNESHNNLESYESNNCGAKDLNALEKEINSACKIKIEKTSIDNIVNDYTVKLPPKIESIPDSKINAIFNSEFTDEQLFGNVSHKDESKSESINESKNKLSLPNYNLLSSEPPQVDDVISDDDELFIIHHDESKLIDIPLPLDGEIFNEVVKPAKEVAVDYRSIDQTDISRKPIGKLKPLNININVNTLMPGAIHKPKKPIIKAKSEEIPGKTDLLNKDSRNAHRDSIESTNDKPLDKDLPDDVIESLSCVSETENRANKRDEDSSEKSHKRDSTSVIHKDLRIFERNINVNALIPANIMNKAKKESELVSDDNIPDDDQKPETLKHYSKDRARIKVKRRPSTRKARLDAIKRVEIDISTSDTVDNSHGVTAVDNSHVMTTVDNSYREVTVDNSHDTHNLTTVGRIYSKKTESDTPENDIKKPDAFNPPQSDNKTTTKPTSSALQSDVLDEPDIVFRKPDDSDRERFTVDVRNEIQTNAKQLFALDSDSDDDSLFNTNARRNPKMFQKKTDKFSRNNTKTNLVSVDYTENIDKTKKSHAAPVEDDTKSDKNDNVTVEKHGSIGEDIFNESSKVASIEKANNNETQKNKDFISQGDQSIFRRDVTPFNFSARSNLLSDNEDDDALFKDVSKADSKLAAKPADIKPIYRNIEGTYHNSSENIKRKIIPDYKQEATDILSKIAQDTLIDKQLTSENTQNNETEFNENKTKIDCNTVITDRHNPKNEEKPNSVLKLVKNDVNKQTIKSKLTLFDDLSDDELFKPSSSGVRKLRETKIDNVHTNKPDAGINVKPEPDTGGFRSARKPLFDDDDDDLSLFGNTKPVIKQKQKEADIKSSAEIVITDPLSSFQSH